MIKLMFGTKTHLRK